MHPCPTLTVLAAGQVAELPLPFPGRLPFWASPPSLACSPMHQAVSDAELLAIYVSRNGMHVSRDGKAVTPEVLQGVTDARQRLVSHTLNGGAAASAFLARWIFSRIFRPDARQTYFFGFWLRSAR